MLHPCSGTYKAQGKKAEGRSAAQIASGAHQNLSERKIYRERERERDGPYETQIECVCERESGVTL